MERERVEPTAIPLPPSPGRNQTPATDQGPSPKHAAIPYNSCCPVQETNPSSEALDHAQAPEAAAPVQARLQALVSHGEEGSDSDNEKKNLPQQETDPAPQTKAHQDEGATSLPVDGQDHAGNTGL